MNHETQEKFEKLFSKVAYFLKVCHFIADYIIKDD